MRMDGIRHTHLHTSYGELELFEDGCELCTDNSVYEFAFGEQDLPENAKKEYLEISRSMKDSGG